MLWADLIELRQTLVSKIINIGIWLSCTIIVMGYIMKAQFALDPNFGFFMLAGCIATVGIFETYPRIFTLISDFEGDQVIFYDLTLPIPSKLVFIKKMLYLTLNFSIMGLFMLPLGKLFLLNQFNMMQVAWIKFVPFFILINAFYATFAFLVASFIPSLAQMEQVWIRFIFPLWFLGGFQYSWQTLHQISKEVSYVALCNPITYIMEGMRAIMLGQDGYLPFWLCLSVISVLAVASGWLAISRLKKRLDFV